VTPVLYKLLAPRIEVENQEGVLAW
jgi:hypothetical protein